MLDTELNDIIVWIDSDARMRLAITILLQGYGIEVVTGRNSFEGIALIREHSPKMVVLHRLDRIQDRLAVCDAVRDEDELQKTFMLVSSTEEESDEMAGLLRCGADMTILRPLDLDELMRIIEDVLQGRLSSMPGRSPGNRIIRYRGD